MRGAFSWKTMWREIAHTPQHISVLLCGVVLGWALVACDAPTHIWRSTAEDESAAEGDYKGIVLLPDPGNIMTGFKTTDETCAVRVRRHAPGSLRVESGFSEEPVVVRVVGLSGEHFYLGRFGDDQALVLQLQPSHGVAMLTHTSFDANGRLNYGMEGGGNFTRECLIQPA